MLRTPWRTTAWSSATRTLVVAGALIAAGTRSVTRVPPAGRRLDRQPAAHEQRPFAHPGDAARLVPDVRRDAAAVVVDGQRDGAVDVRERDRDVLAPAWRTTFVRASCATR